MSSQEFKQYLSTYGLNDATIDKLLSEDIEDLSTLKLLSQEDIDGLGLKTGQKAKLRNIISGALPVGGHPEMTPEVASINNHSRNDEKAQFKPQARPRTSLAKKEEESEHLFIDDDDNPQSSMSRKSSTQKTFSKSKKSEVALDYHCLLSEDKGKVVVDLSTEHFDEVTPLPAKILLLVDISGSMGVKLGRSRRYSKLSKMRMFAQSMVDSLDDGDFVGLVTFGNDANVMLPLEELTSSSRSRVRGALEKLDKTYLSTKTNLSAGLSKAVDVLHGVSKTQEDLLNYRNAIIILSDGEINEGTTHPGKLVHEVREKIRNTSYGLDDSQNQWVTISVIVTGNEVSEAMYMLSKFCSSEAFYHLDIEKSDSESDLFLPVLLRKSAVAWNVSLYAESLNGTLIINEETTQEHKVRLRDNTRDGPRSKKAFLFYDIPAATTKHLGIAINMRRAPEDPETEVLRLDVSFTGHSRKRRKFTKTILRKEFYDDDLEKKASAITANMMHDARLISQSALTKAADQVKSGNASASSNEIESGKSDLKNLLDKYGKMAEDSLEEQEESVRPQIVAYADVLMKNMQNLLDGLTDTGNDSESDAKNWVKIKAVDSAISREAPTISSEVEDEDLYLAPRPNLKRISGNLQGQLDHMNKQSAGRPKSRGSKLGTLQEY
ncbi:hypothetical protein FSP39_019673 [Pinctada imbricata]|uniref:VWFA domain-containing protein n=1 Tax=Pinctada imbricata TaxID=66713 RepID=A0AA88YUB4_PINIB|nr:hypothetical protein FSP39_019673 [Pinctada imbricata]